MPLSVIPESLLEANLALWRERIFLTYKNKDMQPNELSALFQQKDLVESFFFIIDHDNNGSISEEEWTGCFSKLLGDNDATMINWFVDKFKSFCSLNEKVYLDLSDFASIVTDLEFGYRFSALIAPKCRRISNIQIITALEMIASLSTDAKWLSWLKYQFTEAVTHGHSRLNSQDCRLKFEDFKRSFNFKEEFLAQRLFNYLDTDKSGFLSLHEFINGLEIVVNGTDEEKMVFLFKVFDMDGDGRIDYNELRMLLKCCLEDSPSLSVDEGVDDLAIALFRNTDTDCSGEITVDELKDAFKRHDGLFKTLSINTSIWIKPKFINQRKKRHWFKHIKETMINRRGLFHFWTVYILIHIATAIHAYVNYMTDTPYIICARIFGNGLNFNCALVLILVLRKHFTWLRSKGAGAFLPLDHYIDLHKIVGIIILIETIIHTVAHLINLFNKCKADKRLNFWTILFTAHSTIGFPTGVIEILLLFVILLFALSCVRKRGHFQLFYFIHLLTIPWLLIMLLHGKQFWKWLVIPGILYTIEKLLRYRKTRSDKFGDTYISEATLLPSKVTHLVLRKPEKFQYNPGDYVFINIPEIAKYEWHPFSISSVPELDDYIWLHVRAVGNWTTKLNSFVRNRLEAKYTDESLLRTSMRSRMSRLLSDGGILGLPLPSNFQNGRKVNWDAKNTNILTNQYPSQIGLNIAAKRKSILKNMTKDSKSFYFRSTIHDSTPADGTIIIKSSDDETIEIERNNANRCTTMPDDMNAVAKIDDRPVSVANMKNDELEKYLNNILPIKDKTTTESSLDEDEASGYSDEVGLGDKKAFYKKTPINDAIAIEMDPVSQKKSNLYNKNTTNDDILGYLKMYTKANCLSIQQMPVDEQWRLQVYLDGPYGTINRDIYSAEHVVLIAAGIGITPYASILQTLMQRFKRTKNCCPNCDHTWESNLPCTYRSKIKKVDFIWVTREQRSLEWFISMLSQMEIDQKKNNQNFLETHLYVTSAKRQTDLKSIGLHMTLDVIYSEEDSRYIEGLKQRTHYGRPNWDIVLQQLIRKQEGKITVFFCGPLSLCDVLQEKCKEYNLLFKKEIF